MSEPDRELLRTAGEHLGTLAERAKERYDMWPGARTDRVSRAAYNDYVRFARLSQEVLEVANAR